MRSRVERRARMVVKERKEGGGGGETSSRAQLAVAGTVRAAFKAVSQLSHHVQLPRRLIFILLPRAPLSLLLQPPPRPRSVSGLGHHDIDAYSSMCSYAVETLLTQTCRDRP